MSPIYISQANTRDASELSYFTHVNNKTLYNILIDY
jgi:hypothetical protein